MRSQSKKRRALVRKMEAEREAFRQQFPYCWQCGQRATCIHEMARGQHRQAAYQKRFAWFSACNVCNCGVLNNTSGDALLKQLARKRRFDPDGYNLPAFCELKGWRADAISEEDVERFL